MESIRPSHQYVALRSGCSAISQSPAATVPSPILQTVDCFRPALVRKRDRAVLLSDDWRSRLLSVETDDDGIFRALHQ